MVDESVIAALLALAALATAQSGDKTR